MLHVGSKYVKFTFKIILLKRVWEVADSQNTVGKLTQLCLFTFPTFPTVRDCREIILLWQKGVERKNCSLFVLFFVCLPP